MHPYPSSWEHHEEAREGGDHQFPVDRQSVLFEGIEVAIEAEQASGSLEPPPAKAILRLRSRPGALWPKILPHGIER